MSMHVLFTVKEREREDLGVELSGNIFVDLYLFLSEWVS